MVVFIDGLLINDLRAYCAVQANITRQPKVVKEGEVKK